MSFENEITKLFPGEIITLIEIDGSRFGAQTYRFHAENISYTPEELLAARGGADLPEKMITFRGEEYGPRPFGITGINMTSDGQAGKINLSVSNIDSQVSALIRSYDGMVGATVNIWITTANLLQEDGTVNDGDYRKLKYFIERPKSVTPQIAEFELSSPYDMSGIMIPARNVTSVCHWAARGWYRSGNGCTYNGNRYYNKDNEQVSDPSLDFCAGTVRACKLRFGENDQLDHGGCASASLQANKQ